MVAVSDITHVLERGQTTIPARLRFRGQTIPGFVSVVGDETLNARFTFTPDAIQAVR